MSFSIITICYNSEAVIQKTIESVLLQDYVGEVEYHIVDGASTDKTIEIVESYRMRFENKGYKYIVTSEPDKGIYDAMNKGIMRSKGEIIGIINSGDWYEPIALSTVANEYNKKQFDMFYADINLVKADGHVIVKHSKYDTFVTSRHWNHPTSFVTRKIYEELGCYLCEGIHDDFEFFLRVRKAKKLVVIKNEVLANFMTGGASNAKSFTKAVGRIKDRYRCYRKNGYSPCYIFECICIEVAKALIS
jgi:glycosyltransferase involved in cell wall biosynthesis